jgi:hypothetical protein
VVHALGIGEARGADRLDPAADGREILRGLLAGFRLGSKDSPSKSATPSRVALYGS